MENDSAAADADATWAPKSPDLSSYHGVDNEPVHPQHQAYRGSVSLPHPYSPPASSPSQLHARPVLPTSASHLASTPPPPPQFTSPFMPRGLRSDESMHDADADYAPDASEKVRGKRKEGNGTAGPAPDAAAVNPDNINITVHFPVARIKRIMQADDDVGKVAQVTPVVVCAFTPPQSVNRTRP